MATDNAATDVAAITQRLSEGLHELAIAAGQLESAITDGAEVDHDQRIALDQAHSNATAITDTLDRLGRG